MPNWCSTDITIYSSPEDINKLWKHLKEATSKSYVNSDFGNEWLGNIVEHCGKSYRNYECGGSIVNMDKVSNDCILIATEDAWSPGFEPFRLLIDTFAPEAQLFYVATECGTELYWTNDPEYAGKYIIDDIEGKYFAPECCWEPLGEEQLKFILLETLDDPDMKNKPLNEIIHEVEDRMEYVNIHQYEYMEA